MKNLQIHKFERILNQKTKLRALDLHTYEGSRIFILFLLGFEIQNLWSFLTAEEEGKRELRSRFRSKSFQL